MRILVTGATGLLGNNVVRAALDAGHTVRVLARTTSDPRPLDGLDVDRVTGDVIDAAAVRAAVEGMDAVVHSAGYVQIGWSDESLHRAINIDGTRNIASASLAVGARLVQVSTINALGIGAWKEPATETTALPCPVECPYVTTKRAAEQVVREFSADGLDAVIVNPGFMFGPWDWKPSSGKMVLQLASRFAPFAPWGGVSVADVRDVAAGILAAVQRAPAGRQYILGGTNMTYVQIWRVIAQVTRTQGPWFPAGPLMRIIAGRFGDLWGRAFGREPEVNSASVRMSNLPHYFSSERAIAELNYSIRPAADAVEAAWKWFQEHRYA